MQRKITIQEEQVYRLRHHKFGRLSTQETAKRMKISTRQVRRLLKSLRKKAPQLFPILTHRQYIIYWLYTDMGLSQYQIADYLNTTHFNIYYILKRLKKKGMTFYKSHKTRDIITYEERMDNQIIYKF